MPGPDRRAHAPTLLSFAQQRLWFLDRLRPGRPDHNVPTAVRLRGRLDEGALTRALTEVVRRHEVLRGRIVDSEDGPRHVAEPVETFVPTITDLTHTPAEQAWQRARELAAADLATPFDLGTAPMLRARLIRIAPDDHLLLLVIHHIACDGWSLSVLWQEFSAGYGAAVDGRPIALADLPVQYADFADWQRSHQAGTAMLDQLAYWREHLADLSPSVLPADRPRPAVWSGRGDQVEIEIPAELADRIRALGRAHEVTPFMTLLAAFQVLLARCTGQADVTVGTPISGRTRIEVEPLVGFFVNTLVLRTDLSGDPGFTDVLARVRRGAVEAYAHQEVPFERLVQELRPERDLGQHPLFTVMFQLEDPPALPSGLPGLEVSGHQMPNDVAKFDIEVSMTDGGDRFTGVIRYAADLFDRGTVRQLAEGFRVLLDQLVGSPERPISAWETPPGLRVSRPAPAATPGTGTGTEPGTEPESGPATETELLVLETWAEVLGVTPDGVDSDFFELGGHSLLASKVMSRLGRALDLELPVALLFYHPTVAELADGIDAALLADLGAAAEAEPLPAGKARHP
ncbi:condensation domain-containing protein [Kitasatospora sp. NPDC059811]|uniref:condensation domain-containing protein n=1 Tax=Streptomycetaceae TaxID=2062 RepID=UPI0007AF30A5|nr:condensation domain-containing protein [Streptomyces sp. MJM8645]